MQNSTFTEIFLQNDAKAVRKNINISDWVKESGSGIISVTILIKTSDKEQTFVRDSKHIY